MYGIQPSKYVMSLDSLDLSLLPTTYNSWLNNPTSLWTVNNLNGLKNEYFQFEIKPKTETEDLVNKEKLEETTLCYICNTQVPAAYLPDHEESLKHRSFSKIANVVLNRARKHMLKRETRLNIHKNDNNYFCEACVILVKETDRNHHEKSASHKHSVSLDKLLHELVAIYTDEDIEMDNTPQINDNANKVPNSNETVIISDLKAAPDKKEQERNTEDKNKNDHIELVDQDPKKFNSLTLDGANVKIETPDGFVVTVTQDNFHGFLRIGKQHIQCKLCKVIFKSYSENEHKNSEGHIRMIVKPFADKHCVRNLDDSWSHCIICNNVIDNSDVHSLCNEYHTRLLEKALRGNVDDPNFPIDRKGKASRLRFCSTCDIHMDVNDIGTHMSGYKHAANLKLKEDNDMDISSDDTDVTVEEVSETSSSDSDDDDENEEQATDAKSPLHYIMKVAENTEELVCRVCNVYVVDRLPLIRAHVLRPEHRYKLDAFLADNHVTESDDMMFCRPCDVLIRKTYEFYHIGKLSHVENLAAFKALNITSEEKPSYTAVVKQEVANSSETLKESSVDAKVTLKTTIKEEKPEKNSSFFCKCCQVHIPNSARNIKEHNNGERHRINAARKNEIKNPIATQNPQIYYQMKVVTNGKELRCRVCEANIPNKKDNIDEHIKGAKHKSNQQVLMDDNCIETKNGIYYCNICKTFITDQNEIAHIEGLAHRTNKNKQANIADKILKTEVKVKETVEKCKNKVETEQQTPSSSKNNEFVKAIEQQASKLDTIDLYSFLSHHFKEISDKINLQCRLCDDIILNTTKHALDHASQAKHKHNYRMVLETNLIFETDSAQFYCGFCKCTVPGKGELIHAFGLKHTKTRGLALQAHTCDLCNITEEQNMTDHVKTEEHIKMLKRGQTALYHCDVCGCLLTKNDISIPEHMKKCALIKDHKLVVKDRICFCVICDLYFSSSLIEKHVGSQHHLLGFLFNTDRASKQTDGSPMGW